MAKMMQMQQMASMQDDHKDCDGCPKMAQEKQQKKNGCCDDAACNAKCSAMNGGTSMTLPTVKNELPSLSKQVNRLYPVDAALASQHLNAQERPPKSLS